MNISYDAAKEIAQEMVRRGEVEPYIDPPADGKIRVSFFAYVPVDEVSLDVSNFPAEEDEQGIEIAV